MNILVIGNGFDIEHGLPTKYEKFLDFCERVNRIYSYYDGGSVLNYKQEHIFDIEINKEILDILGKAVDNRKMISKDAARGNKYTTNNKVLDEFHSYIYNNTWLEYFFKCRPDMGENWIDFENEISKVIQSLDKLRRVMKKDGTITDLKKEKQNVLIKLSQAAKGSMKEKYENMQAVDKFADSLIIELKRLIRALEIYIDEFVGCITVNRNETIEKLNPDCVLSFNYSDTYEKVYRDGRKIQYDYIHGKADINNTIDTNNMVLGIDEYLSDDRKNKDVEFIAFKKYYQRIHKQTGCKYKEWVDKIRQDYLDHMQKIETTKYKELQYIPDTTQRLFNQYAISAIKHTKCQKHNLYIFGHSLDVTDKDIIRDLILNDNVYTKIYYHSKDAMGQQIANLVKVIGKDELIKRTGGSTKTIEFVPQKLMEPIEH